MKDQTIRRSLRGAIYTRVSTDHGFEQDFNSLDAQRGACEAYIKSQAHEGWRLVRDRYDDGGFSGGSMERPALQKLLIDVQARRIDVIVVYKVDRLTRSLADFAKLVETTVLVGSLMVPVVGPVTIGPLLPASGSAPPDYTDKNELASVDTFLGPVHVTADLLDDTASGSASSGTGTATSTLSHISITLDSLFSLAATTISSTSSVDATPSAIGSTTIEDLVLTVGGRTFTVLVAPPANTDLVSIPGLTVTLNQQIADMSELAGITTNAIAVDLTGFLGVTGSIDVAQSFASIDVTTPSIPEPSTWAMMLLGFAGLGYAAYRKGLHAFGRDQAIETVGAPGLPPAGGWLPVAPEAA